MHERVIIRFKKNGDPMPLDTLTPEGIVINSETDASPRGLSVEFDADSPITKLRLDQVRQFKGWGSQEYKLNLGLLDNALLVTGVDSKSLPAGRYWFRLRIGDLILPEERIKLDLHENQETEVEIDVRPDPRQIESLLTSSPVDQQILHVLSQSTIDGIALPQWVADPLPRPRRKACLFNLLAKLRSAPDKAEPLLANVREIFFADVDRCYGIVDGELFARLKGLAASPDKAFAVDHLPLAPIHRKLLGRIRNMESDADDFRLHNFRQAGNHSLQILLAVPPGGDLTRRFYADFDIDLGNPLEDLLGFLIHFGELITPGKTDHLKLRAKLAEDQNLSEFLYYRVVDED